MTEEKISLEARKRILSATFRCILDFTPFRREELKIQAVVGVDEDSAEVFVYAPPDKIRWPGEVRVMILPDGRCRIFMEGDFFPADETKQEKLEAELKRVERHLNLNGDSG